MSSRALLPAVGRRRIVIAMFGVVVVLALWVSLLPSPASAVEYRLQVANVHQEAFAHYFDGPLRSGSGELVMNRLAQALDQGRIEPGAFLADRTVRYGGEAVARSFEAVTAVTEVKPLENPRRWDEAGWNGGPGERSVWVIAPPGRHFEEVYHVAVQGAGPEAALRYYVPYRAASGGQPQTVIAYSLSFLRFYEGRSDLWRRYLSKSVDLKQGIAVVVGVNDNPTFPDSVYIVVTHPPVPTTFKVVLGWRRREPPELPGSERINP